MARLLTKEERIQHMLRENAKNPCTSMERTYDYCKAFVEGEMAIEAAMKNVKLMHVNFTRAEAIKKCHGINHPECFVQALEAMGLIEFKPDEPVKPVFEHYCPDRGFHYKVWASGRTEGFPPGITLNRIPQLK